MTHGPDTIDGTAIPRRRIPPKHACLIDVTASGGGVAAIAAREEEFTLQPSVTYHARGLGSARNLTAVYFGA